MNGVLAIEERVTRRRSDNVLLEIQECVFELEMTEDGPRLAATMTETDAEGNESEPRDFVKPIETTDVGEGITRTTYLDYNGRGGILELGPVIDVFTREDGSIRNIAITQHDYNKAKTSRTVTVYQFGAAGGNPGQVNQYEQNKVEGQWVNAQA